MSDKQLQTEEQILEAAKKIFQQQGFSGARMQEIADEAGINKSMLHYYFRSKDKLFQKIFQESVRQFFPEILKVLNSNLPLDAKVDELVGTYYRIFEENPHLPSFVIHEMNQHPDRFKQFINGLGVEIPPSFIKQIEEAIAAGRMREVKPREFIINVISLCVFPVIARPMVETVFKMDGREYAAFMKRRRDELSGFILNAVKK